MNDSDPKNNGSIGQFAMVPIWVARRLRGESVALHVWTWLAVKYADRDRLAYPRQEMLAADVGCSLATVERALTVLRNQGVLKTTKLRDSRGYVSGCRYEILTVEATSPPPKSLTLTGDGQDNNLTLTGDGQESLTLKNDGQDKPNPHQRGAGTPPNPQKRSRLTLTSEGAEKKTRSSTTIVRTPLTPLAGGLRITKRDIRSAEDFLRRAWGSCRHDPRCANSHECATRIAWDRRRQQVATAEELAAAENDTEPARAVQ